MLASMIIRVPSSSLLELLKSELTQDHLMFLPNQIQKTSRDQFNFLSFTCNEGLKFC